MKPMLSVEILIMSWSIEMFRSPKSRRLPCLFAAIANQTKTQRMVLIIMNTNRTLLTSATIVQG